MVKRNIIEIVTLHKFMICAKRMTNYFLYRVFVVSIIINPFIFCEGHEMCANGLSLIKNASLKFCSSVSQEYGCCTEEYDSTVRKKYDDIIQKIPKHLADTCASNLKEMLCQICHPLSGHSFESDVNLEMPGLCSKYCYEFFTKCETLIQYLGKKSKNTYLLSKDSRDWCTKVETKDIDYCYPDVNTNKEITLEMSSHGNENDKVDAHVSSLPECVCFKQFQGESILPIKMEELKDGSGRFLVAELPGLISLFHANGTKEKEPYFDIVDYINRKSFEDQHTTFGLPSFALHPSFNSNGKIYIIYAKLIHGKLIHRLSEFVMTSDVKPEKTERIVLELEPPFKFHNLNDLFFGSDGYLYIFNGDGGIQGDPDKMSQNGKTFFGKILRIDVDARSGSKAYGIPPDNPYVDDESLAHEVYAYGLRNPWRCTQDSGDKITGKGKDRIFCADVGYNKFEEINIIKKGGNYGWNGKEGFSCFDLNICNKMENEEFPIFAYNHAKGKSVTGGEVYRGNCIPHLQGKYIFADYYFRYLSTLKESEDVSNAWVREDLTVCDECPAPLTKKLASRIYSFGRDNKGEVYIMATSKNGVIENLPGYIYKIVNPAMMENCEMMNAMNDKIVSESTPHTPLYTQSEADVSTKIGTINDSSELEFLKTSISTGKTKFAPTEQTTGGSITVTQDNNPQFLQLHSLTLGHKLSNSLVSTETFTETLSRTSEGISKLVTPPIASNQDQVDKELLQHGPNDVKNQEINAKNQERNVKNQERNVKEHLNVTLDQDNFVVEPSTDDKNVQNEKNNDNNLDVSELRKVSSRNGSRSKYDKNTVLVKLFVLIAIIYHEITFI